MPSSDELADTLGGGAGAFSGFLSLAEEAEMPGECVEGFLFVMELDLQALAVKRAAEFRDSGRLVVREVGDGLEIRRSRLCPRRETSYVRKGDAGVFAQYSIRRDLCALRALRDRLFDSRCDRLAMLDLVIGFMRGETYSSRGSIGAKIDEILVHELPLAIGELLEPAHAPALPKSERARRFPVEPI